jgi:hypothetical protein
MCLKLLRSPINVAYRFEQSQDSWVSGWIGEAELAVQPVHSEQASFGD